MPNEMEMDPRERTAEEIEDMFYCLFDEVVTIE